ncbi:putative holin [Herbaspirillum sp.]|uniref:putative holin n=1 Tax=Herbaspirillum sp. TaxID=1890675 RepID=UPI001B1C64C6|nr:putative holin [Herbaspirillum sp.]MBO9538743.1 putative holin [Herbaspirillum sp.]
MKLPRLFWWLFATVVLLAFIGLFYPTQLPVSLYKLSLVTMAGVIGYWLDRSLFPYARPDSFIEPDDGAEPCKECGVGEPADGDRAYMPCSIAFAAAMLRRALIVGCAMIAIGLGA